MCNFDSGGHSDFTGISEHRARKPYHCSECQHVIQPGEVYRRCFGKFEGELWSERQCLDCAAVADALLDAQRRECDGHSGYLNGALWDAVQEFCEEHLGYDPRDHESEAA